MRLQQGISTEIQARKVGSVMKVVIDRVEGDYYVGRTQYCSPEVDPEVLVPVSSVRGGALKIGAYYNMKITDSDEFDVYAQPAE